MKNLETDFLVVGGGPVGLILALALAKSDYQVIVVEKDQPDFLIPQSANAFDGRALALSYGSVQFLKTIGVWREIVQFTTAIKTVHVSQKGYFGITTITADELNVPALGYSIQGRDLGQSLWSQVQDSPSITVLANSCLQEFEQSVEISSPAGKEFSQDYFVNAKLLTNQTESVAVKAHILVGADGTQSSVRKALGFDLHKKDYQETGILARIETAENPQGMAFERFTESGPMALLPLNGHYHKAVWVCPSEQKDEILALDDTAFLQAFSERMGERFGGYISVSKRLAYPLVETSVDKITQGFAVLMGNAAHTQHPVAAQGLNLGIDDIADFIDHLSKVQSALQNQSGNRSTTKELFSTLLVDYELSRQAKHQAVMGMTDSLIQLFEHPSSLIGHARGLGLTAMQALPPLKKRFAQFAMGK